MITSLKQFVKRKNELGRLLWIEAAYRFPGSLYRYPSIKRFVNWVAFMFRRLLRRKYISPGVETKKNSVFYELIYRSPDSLRKLRIPRLSGRYECTLREQLKNEANFQVYRTTIREICDDPILGCHFPKVFEVRKDGGYSVTHIRGYSLEILRNLLRDGRPLPSNVVAEKLARVVEQLWSNVNRYREDRGKLIGQWSLSSLIYGADDRRIYNVDVDSCYVYADGPDRIGMDFLESELKYIGEMLRTRSATEIADIRLHSVLSAVGYPSRAEVAYNAQAFSIGYHSLLLAGKYFRGQRECATRLASVPYDFRNRTILDLGCNRGGMLHCLTETIRVGIGVDYDYKCINAANMIKQLNQSGNLHFYTLDLDHEDLSLVNNFLMSRRVDICFLLSVCAWIDNWKNVITFTAKTADNLLFESHGTDQQRRDQLDAIRANFNTVKLVNAESEDDPGQKGRSLYLCSGSRLQAKTEHQSVLAHES